MSGIPSYSETANMRERRKNFRVEWNSPGKIYHRSGRFAGLCTVSNFSNGGARITGVEPAQFRTSSFSASFLMAAPTNATSLGVQRTVWGWNLLATPKVSESQQLVAGKSDCLPRWSERACDRDQFVDRERAGQALPKLHFCRYFWVRVERRPARPCWSIECCQERNSSTVSV